MTTRTGKIARLPHVIRQELNRRLQDGETGTRLIKWLNSLADTRRVLAQDFKGRAINEQNLSEWKAGGYREWEQRQESHDHVRQLVEQTKDRKTLQAIRN